MHPRSHARSRPAPAQAASQEEAGGARRKSLIAGGRNVGGAAGLATTDPGLSATDADYAFGRETSDLLGHYGSESAGLNAAAHLTTPGAARGPSLISGPSCSTAAGPSCAASQRAPSCGPRMGSAVPTVGGAGPGRPPPTPPKPPPPPPRGDDGSGRHAPSPVKSSSGVSEV